MNLTLYHLLMSDPYLICMVVFIAIATISLWIFKSPYVFFLGLAGTLVFAFLAKVLPIIHLISFGVLAITFYALGRPLKRMTRSVVFIITAVLAIALMMGFSESYKELHLMKDVLLGPKSEEFDLAISVNDVIIGLLALGLCIPLIFSSFSSARVIKKTVIGSLLIAFVFFATGSFIGVLSWEPKIPSFSLPFLFSNLFLLVVPQEAFFRGFLQRQFSLLFKSRALKFGAILFASLIFLVVQIVFVSYWPLLVIGFISSLMLGFLYHITGSIESVIITHFFINTMHLFFFTYPYMSTA